MTECPTCGSTLDENGERPRGVYVYKGEEHPCDCVKQIQRRRVYLYANIPDLYHRYTWDDFIGDDNAKSHALSYLENWNGYKHHGVGLGFISKQLGTGKTMCTTLIGKELIKRGESVFFLPHNQMVEALRYRYEDIIERLNTTNVVILDDIMAPPHDTLSGIFADNLESIIRNRTNYNGTTLISSNLSEDELRKHYERVWSVLEPKMILIEMQGLTDARQTFVSSRMLEECVSGELAPID